jgi:hypothetical protein
MMSASWNLPATGTSRLLLEASLDDMTHQCLKAFKKHMSKTIWPWMFSIQREVNYGTV